MLTLRSELRHLEALGRFAAKTLSGRTPERALLPAIFSLLAGLAYQLTYLGDLGGQIITAICLFVSLVAISLFDARYFIIPNVQIGALATIGAVDIVLTDAMRVPDRAVAAILAYFGLRVLSLAYRTLRGAAGLGQGDAKLLGAGAIWIGLDGLPTCILWAAISGMISVGILRLSGVPVSRRTALPFGPHICVGIWLVWVFGPLTVGA